MYLCLVVRVCGRICACLYMPQSLVELFPSPTSSGPSVLSQSVLVPCSAVLPGVAGESGVLAPAGTWRIQLTLELIANNDNNKYSIRQFYYSCVFVSFLVNVVTLRNHVQACIFSYLEFVISFPRLLFCLKLSLDVGTELTQFFFPEIAVDDISLSWLQYRQSLLALRAK